MNETMVNVLNVPASLKCWKEGIRWDAKDRDDGESPETLAGPTPEAALGTAQGEAP